jgi:hypothetical protein
VDDAEYEVDVETDALDDDEEFTRANAMKYNIQINCKNIITAFL